MSTSYIPSPSSSDDSDIDSSHWHRSLLPISAARDVPYTPLSSPRYDPLGIFVPAPTFPPLNSTYVQYVTPYRKEIFPGILEDGTITVRHRFVEAYLAKVRLAPDPYEKTAQEAEEGHAYGWGCKEKKGQGDEHTVADVLGVKMTELQCDCVFALAALKVYYHPLHPAHFTFWAKETMKQTAERVQNILELKPCPIASPVGWMDIHENLSILGSVQHSCFPPLPSGKKAGGMTLRKRKAEPATTPKTTTDDVPAQPRPKRVKATPKTQDPSVALTPVRHSVRLASATPRLGSALHLSPSTPEIVVTPPTRDAKLERMGTPIPPAVDLSQVTESSSSLLLEPFTSTSGLGLTPSPLTDTSLLPEVSLSVPQLPSSEPSSHSSSTLIPVPTTRRSSRQSNRRAVSASTTSTPSLTPVSLPSDSLPVMPVTPEQEAETTTTTSNSKTGSKLTSKSKSHTHTRARSSSAGSSTAVSESGSVETVVESETDCGGSGKNKNGNGKVVQVVSVEKPDRPNKGKRKRGAEVKVEVEVKEDQEVEDLELVADLEKEETTAVTRVTRPRTSARPRKLTAAAKAAKEAPPDVVAVQPKGTRTTKGKAKKMNTNTGTTAAAAITGSTTSKAPPAKKARTTKKAQT